MVKTSKGIMRLTTIIAITGLILFLNQRETTAASVLSSVSISAQTNGPIIPGATAYYSVTVSRTDNGNLDVYLSVSGLPAGATGYFSPAMVHFTGSTPSSGTTTLAISTDSSVTGCSNLFSVTGTDGGSFNIKTCTGALLLSCAPAIPAVLTGNVMPGGEFQLLCNGSPNQTCVIQATTNLCAPNWINIGTNTSDGNGILHFIDGDAKNYPARFYRTAMY